MAVACAHLIWVGGVQRRADELVADLPSTAWATQSAGAGSQGERLADWAWLRLPYDGAAGFVHWLVVRRGLSDPTQLAYFHACGPDGTAAAELIRVAGLRWAIEVGFEDAKDVIGLDQYEVRNWTPWHRHITLALLAHAYLVVMRHTVTGNDDKKGGLLICCP
jgi:SRSO17 transposase